MSPSIPSYFATVAGYDDLAAGLLAILALVALRQRWATMIPLVWLSHILGILDLVNAVRHAEAIPHLGSAWYVPTFVVPVLLVIHVVAFARLLQTEKRTLANAESTT